MLEGSVPILRRHIALCVVEVEMAVKTLESPGEGALRADFRQSRVRA